jgi:hypothetical protein
MALPVFMRMRPAFFLVAFALSPSALAAFAGSVDSLSGTVTVSRSGAPPQRLGPGASVVEGDRLKTGADSWVLLEMVDGAALTLRPDTELKIDAYSWSETRATSGTSWVTLVQGALRSITGAIGKFNSPGYRVSTPIVTVGIRGTDHETAYYPPGSAEAGNAAGVYDKVNEGETVLRSAQGEVRVRSGQAAFSPHGAAQRPRLLAQIPAFYGRHAALDRPLKDRLQQLRQRRENRIHQIRQRIEKHAGPARNAGQGREQRRQHAEELRQHRLERPEELRKHQPGEPAKEPRRRERKLHPRAEPN